MAHVRDFYVENVLAVLSYATDEEWREGTSWYADAHALALELSPDDVWRASGVIAAFSPMKRWETNVSLARRAFSTGTATGHTRAMNGLAQRILDGEPPMSVLKGDKTRSFCEAIALEGMGDIATIDRHAHDIAMGCVFREDDRTIGKRLFRAMSDAYHVAARESSLSVNQIQAVTWVTWRRMKGE